MSLNIKLINHLNSYARNEISCLNSDILLSKEKEELLEEFKEIVTIRFIEIMEKFQFYKYYNSLNEKSANEMCLIIHHVLLIRDPIYKSSCDHESTKIRL